jgi:hypothetical protein
MAIYDIDFYELSKQLLPVRLRKSKLLAWMRAMVAGVKQIFTEFKAFRGAETGALQSNSVLYDLAHNGQVCYVEAALNDVFDALSRGIYITDGEFDDPLYVYLEAELKPVWAPLESETPGLEPLWLYTDAEVDSTGADFIVHVPSAVALGAVYDLDRLKAIVNHYKLPGKRYSVVIE